MKCSLTGIINQIENKGIQDLVIDLIYTNDYFWKCPGGCTKHHSYEGGLRDHVTSVAHLAADMCDHYPSEGMNKDIVIAGALLHDIGKVFCYEGNEQNGYRKTHRDKWHHHIPIGFHMVAKQGEKLIDEDRLDQYSLDHILHIIISHHGRVSWASNRVPDTSEAFVVHQADLIDAYMNSNDKGFYQNV